MPGVYHRVPAGCGLVFASTIFQVLSSAISPSLDSLQSSKSSTSPLVLRIMNGSTRGLEGLEYYSLTLKTGETH